MYNPEGFRLWSRSRPVPQSAHEITLEVRRREEQKLLDGAARLPYTELR